VSATQAQDPGEWIRSEFERCAPFLQRAIDRTDGLYTIEHVWKEIESGTAQFWPLPNSVMITKIETYPTGVKICNEWLAGGKLEDIVLCEQHVSEWAKRMGCDRICIAGRRGWLRKLPGYEVSHTILRKDLRP
jgi:hypothetical protein